MSRLNDLKEQLKNRATETWDKFEESTAYNQLKDQFQNQSPRSQQLIIFGASFLVILIIISFPYRFLSSAYDQVSMYEDQRGLIHDLFKIQQDSQASTGLNPGPSLSSLQSRVDMELKNSMLAPEQIKSIQSDPNVVGIPKEFVESTIQVYLGKLNLRQIVDIGHQLLNIDPTLKMLDLNIEPNSQDARYFDVVYKIAGLKVPTFLPPPPPEEDKPKKGEKKGNKPNEKKGGGDE